MPRSKIGLEETPYKLTYNIIPPLFLLMLLLLSLEHGEGLQILHYEVGQKYEPHYDYFADEFNTINGGQRIATVLMYL